MEKTIIRKILKQECFLDKPPVLVDVGASGELRKIWKSIAPFSIHRAFDADNRDFNIEEKSQTVYKKSFVINRLVSDDEGQKNFYLTKEPHGSSTLEPDLLNLSRYHMKSYFEVKRRVQLQALPVKKILNELDIPYVDWFKTDTQGTDLKIFKSLGDGIMNKILVAELEIKGIVKFPFYLLKRSAELILGELQ